MRVEIDEAGRDDQIARVDHARCRRLRQRTDRHDPAALNRDVGAEPRIAGAVEHVSAANENVVWRCLSAGMNRRPDRHGAHDSRCRSSTNVSAFHGAHTKLRGRRLFMKLVGRAALIVASLAAFLGAQEQSGSPSIEPLHFHHVHLNSMNPAAAAEYYTKPFAKYATKATFNGLEAVKTGNIYILFTKVNTPPTSELPGPQTSVWHFGCNTPDSRKYNEMFRSMGLEIAQMWDAADGKLVDMSRDTLAGAHTQEQ